MSKSVNGECEPWVVASRLRDHLLLPNERKDPVIWKKVFFLCPFTRPSFNLGFIIFYGLKYP